jgi:hypothetical protein
MRFLADVNIERGIIDHLSQNGYDIKWIPEYDRQMSDEALLDMAVMEKRILIAIRAFCKTPDLAGGVTLSR